MHASCMYEHEPTVYSYVIFRYAFKFRKRVGIYRLEYSYIV